MFGLEPRRNDFPLERFSFEESLHWNTFSQHGIKEKKSWEAGDGVYSGYFYVLCWVIENIGVFFLYGICVVHLGSAQERKVSEQRLRRFPFYFSKYLSRCPSYRIH